MVEPPYDLERPKGLEEYVLREVANKSYLIFDKQRNTILCTRCGSEREWDSVFDVHLKHNREHYCVDCGATVTCKEKRYGRKKLTEYGRILWLTADGEKTYIQMDLYEIDYTGDFPKVNFLSDAQYLFSKEQQKRFEIRCSYFLEDSWIELKNIILRSPNYFSGFVKTVVYIPSLTCTGTDLRYADVESRSNPYELVGYISNFLKYQSIELLEKAGFKNIVRDKSNGRGCRDINWRGTCLEKILKMTKGEIKEFRSYDSMEVLENYNMGKRCGIDVSFSKAKYFGYGWKDAAEIIQRYTPLEKAMDYLLGQKGMNLRIYADYLDECKKLRFDMTNRRILRPKNLAEQHAITSQMVKDNNDEIIRENFIGGLESVYDKGTFVLGDLMIRPANSVEELDKESEKLHHCVRTYKERVAKGKCAILFIRKVSDPDNPFYTLELNKHGKIVQVRGLLNCRTTEEVDLLVNEWMKNVVNKKRKGAA